MNPFPFTSTDPRPRTLAESAEDLRFHRVLITLDHRTATLLLCERVHWQLAELARQREQAQREETRRMLRNLQDGRWGS